MIRALCVGLLACLFGIMVVVPVAGASITKTEPSNNVPDDMRWEPWWREKGDCGPLALFVLMRLQNKQITLADVKKLIHLDPEEGCSLKNLQAAAEQLGMATEARFVEPRDLCNVPGPFIVHGFWSIEKNRGHFFVVLDYDSKKEVYTTIDTTLAKLDGLPRDSVLHGYSGYILVPKVPASRKWNRSTGYSLLFVGVVMLSLWSYGMFRQRRRIGT